MQSQTAARCLRRQKENFVEPLARGGLEQRENRAYGFANARWRLRHQAGAGHAAFVHRTRQVMLARTKARIRKLQRLECAVSRLAVQQFLPGPDQKALAVRLKKFLQRSRSEMLG